jgi:hypothetical protein
MFRRFLFTLGLFVLLTGCAPATATHLPTRAQTPNKVTPSAFQLPDPMTSPIPPNKNTPTPPGASPTPEAIPEPVPTDTLQTLPTLELPKNLTATAVSQPTVTSGAIQIFSPGPLSKMVSPMKVYGYAVPGYGNESRLDLTGEDGRLLASQTLEFSSPYKWAHFYWELSFNIRSVGELGRLTLTSQDEYGRVFAVNSVHLLLFSDGPSIINPPGNLNERCVIEQPVAGQRISGGNLTVVGEMRPFNNLPLTVDLIAQDGSDLGIQLVAIQPAADGSFVSFRADVPYRTPYSTWALLVVRQNDDRIGGTMYLYSQQVFLYP